MTKETYLFLDTETTGFKKKGATIQDGQARVCQLAMILTDINGRPLSKFSSLVKPDGWKISEGAAKCNGLTDEICEQYGLDYKSVFRLYKRFSSMAGTLVAHNSNFDRGMMEIEGSYYNETAENKVFVSKPWYCTMEMNKTIHGGKSLENCLKHHCGRSVGKDAHDAMVDTQACMDIFFAMREKKVSA